MTTESLTTVQSSSSISDASSTPIETTTVVQSTSTRVPATTTGEGDSLSFQVASEAIVNASYIDEVLYR